MIGHATMTFSYDSDGHFLFPLTVWITGMKTQNLPGIDFCQKQVSGVHIDHTGIEIKKPSKSICHNSFNQNTPFPQLPQVLTIRIPQTMCSDAKSASCWKYLLEVTHTHFPLGSFFSTEPKCSSYRPLIHNHPTYSIGTQSPDND